MPLEVTAPRWNRYLSRLFGVKGGSRMTLLEDVMPVIPLLEDLSPDVDILRGEYRYGAGIVSNAVAGQFSIVALSNPVGSGHLLSIERIYLCNIGAGNATFTWHPGLTVFAGVTGFPWDGRAPPLSLGAISARQNAVEPTGAGQLPQVCVAAHGTSPVIEPARIVVPPGLAATVWCRTVNNAVLVGFEWTERLAEAGELVRLGT